jgi:ATP-dependent helicase/nuclease subunit B
MKPGLENCEPARRRLLLGPAGCGKSRLVRAAFAEAVRAGDAQRVLLLVPTASYREHTRNEVLRESELKGLAGEPICTFSDLLRRLAPASGPVLTGARRELLLRRLLSELALPEFRAVEEFPGFRAALAESVEELRRAGLTPEMLRAALPGREHRPFLSFFEVYDKALEKAGIDEGRQLRLATGAIRSGALRLRLLLVDGFSDFTPEQRALLEALLQPGPGAERPAAQIALTLDRQTGERQSAGFFYQAERSRAWLQLLGFADQWLEGNRRAAGVLAAVEAACRLPSLRDAQRVESGREEAKPADAPLTLLAAADRRDEIELMAREALRLGRSGMPWREIGIIVHQPAIYAPLLREAFRALGVPLRSFVPVPLLATAYGAHLRLCLDLFAAGSRPESIFRWLKSPYCTLAGLRESEIFEYRAIQRLTEAREGRWEKVVRPESRLAGVLKRLAAFDCEFEEPARPAAMAARVTRLWEDMTRLHEIPEETSAGRALELRGEAAAMRRCGELLAEVAEAAEPETTGPMPFSEFRQLLLRRLAEEQIHVRDRRADAVNLMSTFEARQWELSAVLVPGLVEKEFPSAAGEALFVDDADRRAIQGAHAITLPVSADWARDQRLLFYIAVSRARSRLFLSYPQTDLSGKQLLRSFLLRDLKALLQGPGCRMVVRRRSDGVPPAELAAGEDDLLAFTHAELARWPERTEPRALALALYEALRAGGATSRAMQAARPLLERLAEPAALDLLRLRSTRFSPSALETFARCPFNYFVSKTMGLQAGPLPAELDFLVQGNIAHAVIEEWEGLGRGRPIGEILDRCFDEKLDGEGIPASHLSAKIHQEMRRFLGIFEQAEREHPQRYHTAIDPRFIELKFGAGGLPPVHMTVDGAAVEIRGRFDRVESVQAGPHRLGLVVDYKYSSSGFDKETLADIEEGRDLQLPVYLIALEEVFGLKPAAAELYPLKANPPIRCGLYDRSLAGSLIAGALSKGAIECEPDGFQALMEKGREWIKKHVTDIRGGVIKVRDAPEDACYQCEFFDLCRVGRRAAAAEARMAQ